VNQNIYPIIINFLSYNIAIISCAPKLMYLILNLDQLQKIKNSFVVGHGCGV